MVCGFSAEGGSRNYRFSTYDDCSDLADALILYRKRAIPPSSFFLRAESFFTMATQARDYDRGRSAMSALHEMSHGEGFLEIMLSRNAPGLYLMDEPESACPPAGSWHFWRICIGWRNRARSSSSPPIRRYCSDCQGRRSFNSMTMAFVV